VSRGANERLLERKERMTAAAIRPHLFSHLFATQQERHSKSDVAATAMSVAFHVGVIGALMWLGGQVSKPAALAVVDPVPIVPTYVDPVPAAETPTASSGTEGRSAPGFSPVPQFPTEMPSGIADPLMDDPWFNPGNAPASGQPVDRSGAGAGSGTGEPTRDGFAIMKTLPKLLNSNEVTRALVRNYPAFLRDAGVGGDVLIWLLIDENGRVIETDIKESSGHAALDQAALQVGEVMRFSPASNRDQRVKVWVSVPVKFRTR
jgi:periplasmic protein TonB